MGASSPKFSGWKKKYTVWLLLFLSMGEPTKRLLKLHLHPSKTNMEPKNGGLEDVFSFSKEAFSGSSR